MNGLNKVQVIGNLGDAGELRYTSTGQAVLRIRVAANESYVDKSGERQFRTEWITCVIWGKTGESLNKILNKGSQVYVEGRLQTRSWEDKNNQKRYTTEVVANNVLLLGSKSHENDIPQPPNEDFYPF